MGFQFDLYSIRFQFDLYVRFVFDSICIDFFPLEELHTFVSAHALTRHETATRHYMRSSLSRSFVSQLCLVMSGMENHSHNDPARSDQDKVSRRAAPALSSG